MYKKFFLMILVLCLVLGGCGSQVSARPKIGLCVRRTDDRHRDLCARLDALGCQVSAANCGADQSLQNSQAAQLLEEGCQILLVEPALTGALDRIIASAQGANIPVILLEQQPEQAVLDSWNHLYYLGWDPAQSGRLQGQLAKEFSGSYAIIQGPQNHLDAQLHREGILSVLPEERCLEICCTDWSQSDARAQCARLLAKHPVKTLLCGNAATALGALEAAKNTGQEDLRILAAGPLPTQAQGIYAWVCPDEEAFAGLAASTVQALLEGRSPQKIQYVPWLIVREKE